MTRWSCRGRIFDVSKCQNFEQSTPFGSLRISESLGKRIRTGKQNGLTKDPGNRRIVGENVLLMNMLYSL